MWRETFHDTDEWAPEAPLLPHEIVVRNSEVTTTEDGVSQGRWGYTTMSGIVVVMGLNRENMSPECSVLGHELVHVALAGAYGDGDRNHEEPGGPWTQKHNRYIHSIGGCDG
jgi:hypothetical protein